MTDFHERMRWVFGECVEAAKALSTKTCIRLARSWQRRHPGSAGGSVESIAASALCEVILDGRNVPESIHEEVEAAVGPIKMAEAILE